MEEGIAVAPQSSRRKRSENTAAVKTKSKKKSSFPSIPIKIPIIHRLKNLSKRKGRSISIPEEEDIIVTSENAPVTLYARKKREGGAAVPVTPPSVRRKTIMESIDRATNMVKPVVALNSPDKAIKKRSSNSPRSIKQGKNDGSVVDRWDISYSTMKTADMSTSTAASPHSPHSLGSMGRHKHRIRQSMSQSKSSLDRTPENSSELSPGNDSKRSLTISELAGSKRSITISELGASFSTRPSSYSTRPPRSYHLRTSGTSSSHLRTSTSGSSSYLRHSASTSNLLQDSGLSSPVLPESFRSRAKAASFDTADPTSSTRSSQRSLARSTTRSTRSENKKREKTLSLAQSSSATSLEHYGKLSQRRSSATQESLTTATSMLYDELGASRKLNLLLNAGEGSKRPQRTSNSGRSQRSISIRSGSRRSASRRSGSPSRCQRSKSPSQRQRSLHEMVAHSFISTSSSDDGVSSLEDSPSVEEILRRNLGKTNKDQPPQRRTSTKQRNDARDRSLMRRGSRDLSISVSKSQDSFDPFYDSTSSLAVRGGSRRSTRTSGNSKRSSRTTGISKRSSSGISKRSSGATDRKKKTSPRIKSDAASLRGIPRTIEFATNVATNTPESPSLDVSKSSSSKTYSSRSLSSKSSKLSPVPSTSPNMKRPASKYSPKAASTGARILFKAKKKQSKKKTKDQFQRSPTSQASESLPSLFGTALCLDHSSHHKPTTSPFLQYDIALNDARPQTAVRQRSVGSLSRASSSFRKNSLGSLDGSGRASSSSHRFPKNSFGSLDGSADFVLTEEEEGGASGGMTSPSVSLASDFISAASSSLLLPPTGLRLPSLQQQKKKKKKVKKKRVVMKKKKKRSSSTVSRNNPSSSESKNS